MDEWACRPGNDFDGKGDELGQALPPLNDEEAALGGEAFTSRAPTISASSGDADDSRGTIVEKPSPLKDDDGLRRREGTSSNAIQEDRRETGDSGKTYDEREGR